ncbi:MAG: ATP-binding protein [Magnetococcales bacterium]|nr:ATP-binding protein [Magnetococcales bacterium]
MTDPQTDVCCSPSLGTAAQPSGMGVAGVPVVYLFKTPDEARTLAGQLARFCPDPAQAMIGLLELLLNAVEHGNLGISYAEKSALVRHSALGAELERRLLLPEYADKTATVSVSWTGDEIHFLIRDQGTGFDWSPYLEIDPARVRHPHGRGIAWARGVSFQRIEYRGIGNEVLAVVRSASLSQNE